MKTHPFKSIRKLLQWQTKEYQVPEQQSRRNAPANMRRPCIQESVAPTVDSDIANPISDFFNSMLETGAITTADRNAGDEDRVSNPSGGNARDVRPSAHATVVGGSESLQANCCDTTMSDFSNDYSAHCSSMSQKMDFVPHASAKKSNDDFSDALSQRCTVDKNCTTEFKISHHHYDENQNKVETCVGVTTDHDDGVMKRRATTYLESNRVLLPPGSCIASGNCRTTFLEENHYWNDDETKVFENDEMFPDVKVKMPFMPLSSSIKHLFGLPPDPRPMNVMEWLLEEAPTDVVPQILSFVGSRKLLALSTLNSKWRRTIMAEPTWQTLCEDTGKVCF
jgi:hypothetical protein